MSAEPAVCACMCAFGPLQVRQRIAAFQAARENTSGPVLGCIGAINVHRRPECWVGLGEGDLKVRNVMSWVDNYSDCAFWFPQFRPRQSKAGSHEQGNGAGFLLGSKCSATNKESSQGRKPDYTEQ